MFPAKTSSVQKKPSNNTDPPVLLRSLSYRTGIGHITLSKFPFPFLPSCSCNFINKHLLPSPVVSSEKSVAKKPALSIPSARAQVSPARVLHTTLQILSDCKRNGENVPFSPISMMRCPPCVPPSGGLPIEEPLNTTSFRQIPSPRCYNLKVTSCDFSFLIRLHSAKSEQSHSLYQMLAWRCHTSCLVYSALPPTVSDQSSSPLQTPLSFSTCSVQQMYCRLYLFLCVPVAFPARMRIFPVCVWSLS